MIAPRPEPVDFITIEDGDDLIVSFAIALDEPGEVLSLTLLRTPKFEFILDPAERGVHVSHESYPEDDGELLREFVISGTRAELKTTRRTYLLDLTRVEKEELREAQRVLQRMNVDRTFRLGLSSSS